MAKIQIRQGVFETNSSSTHSITMCESSSFNKWKDGELYIKIDKEGDEQFLLTDVAKKWNKDFILNNHDKITWFTKENYEDYETDELGYVIDCEYSRYCYSSYDQWCNIYNCYEIYSNDYETKSGDKITAFGYYGHD